MKKVFALWLFLILPFTLACGQGLHGRIFILEDSAFNPQYTFDSFLPSIYSGVADSGFALPQDLADYDAIFVFPDYYDSIKFSDQISLIDYLKAGGRLYAETSFFVGAGFLRNPYGPFDTIHDPDTLWHFLGLRREIIDAFVNTYELFFGVDSEFTAGLSIPYPYPYDSISPLVPFTYFPSGNFIPVLYGQELEEDDIFAWTPSDKSIRAVMHFHPSNISYYCASFFTRVLCDYFGLCADAVQEQRPTPSNDLRVIEDGDETWFVVSGQEESELDIVNTLGMTVFHQVVNATSEKIVVPANLSNGVYFARLRGNGISEMQPFALIQK